MKLNREIVGEVESLKYLEAIIQADKGVESDVSDRMNEGCILLGGFKNIMKNREIKIEVKRKLHERILVPTGMYV